MRLRSWMIGMMVLAAALPATGTTYYISPTGNNGNNGLTAGAPKQTLANALSTSGAGTHTYRLMTGTYTETWGINGTWNTSVLTMETYDGPVTVDYSATGNSTINFTTAWDSTSVTIDGGVWGFTFAQSGAGTAVATIAGEVQVTLRDVTINGVGSQNAIAFSGDTRTLPILIEDCTFNSGPSGGYGISFANGGPVTMRGCTISAYNQAINMGTTAFTAVLFEDNVLTSQTNRALAQGGTPTFASCILRRNTVTASAGGLYVPGTASPGIIQVIDNTVTVSTSGTAYGGIEVGLDLGPTANPFSAVEVRGNTVRNAGTGKSHCILVGPNAEGALVADNDAAGGNVQIAIKANNAKVIRNVAYGPYPLGIAEGDNILIEHNSCYSTEGPALRWTQNHTNNDPSMRFVMRNNIFDGGTGTYAVIDQNTFNPNALVDYNVYRAGASGLFYMNGADRTSLALIQAQWASYSPLYADNDANSVVQTTAIMANPADGDFRPRVTARALKAASSAQLDIGAVQHEDVVRRGSISR